MRNPIRLIALSCLAAGLLCAADAAVAAAPQGAANPAARLHAQRGTAVGIITAMKEVTNQDASGWNVVRSRIDKEVRALHAVLGEEARLVGDNEDAARALQRIRQEFDEVEVERRQEHAQIEIRYRAAAELGPVLEEAGRCLETLERTSVKAGLDLAPVVAGYEAVAARAQAVKDDADAALGELKAVSAAWEETREKMRKDLAGLYKK